MVGGAPVMELPRDLRPWTEQLGIFPRDVALSLGGLVRRLSVAISPLRVSHLHGEEEPDGISGLQNQPAYERLLPSEWLLAEEIPEEFERRAVMGEQLFFRRHTRHSSHSALSVALFDCGPSQLGTPRIVHMALLILMQRRAQAAKAGFLWGILQDSGSLYEHLSVNTIHDYLKSRSALSVTNEMSAAWQDKLATLNQLNELWIIGADKHSLQAYDAKNIQVMDECTLNETALKVVVQGGKRSTTLQLPLPGDDICTRLLRDPFQSIQPPLQSVRSSVAAHAPLLFSSSGRKLIVALENGSMMQHPLPNSPKANPGYPHYHDLPKDHIVVAAQMLKRRLMCVTLKDQTLYFYNIPGMAWSATMPLAACPEVVLSSRPTGLKPLLYSFEPGYPHSVFFVDDARQLVRTTWTAPGVSAAIIGHNVASVTMVNNKVNYLRVDGDASTIVILGVNTANPEQRYIKLDQLPTGKAFFSMQSYSPKIVESVALELSASLWKLVHGGNHSLLSAFPGTEVIGMFTPPYGVGGNGFASRDPALIIIEQDRRTISIINKDQQVTALKESAKIIHAVYDPNYRQVAYVLKNKTIKVFSLLTNQHVLSIQADNDGKNA